MRDLKLTRRGALKAGLVTTAASSLGLFGERARAQAQPADRKFLFVVCAAGGGSLIDSFLPVVDSESQNGSTRVAYPAALVAQPAGSSLRVVEAPLGAGLGEGFKREFVQRHMNDIAVMTQEGTSVNHLVAQKRSVNGAGINKGRTLMEAHALRHGEGMLLANVNMAASGFLEPGDDPQVPSFARGVPVADALLFPLSTDGVRGVPGAPGAPDGEAPDEAELARTKALLARARGVRDRLEQKSVFGQTFRNAPVRRSYLDNRAALQPAIEASDLITKLMMVPDVPAIPLGQYGLRSSEEQQRVFEVFPNLIEDPFEAQAALAFLLVRYGVSCTVTISPSFSPLLQGGQLKNPPLAFDFSHNDHVTAQYVMWRRVLKAIDGLITLLKEQPYGDGTLWDRSLVYVATDFGRSKTRPDGASQFGSGHHLNNGNLFISPLLRGNRVYGGVDPDTCLTYGFDLETGEPLPTPRALGELPPPTMPREGHVYSAAAQALDIDFEGRIDIPCMMRS